MGLDRVPFLPIDNAGVFTGVGDTLMHGNADINGIAEQFVEHALADQPVVFVADIFCDKLPG